MPELRRKNSLLTLRTEDLKSLTSVRTRVNTNRNSRTDSMSSAGSESRSCSGSTSSDEVEECDCCSKNGRQGRKVRFAHPVVTQVFGEPRITFAEPLTNTPIMSEEDRQRSREKGRLDGTVYQGMNAGPICSNVRAHYSGKCKCPPNIEEEEEEEQLEGEAEAVFDYNGPVYYDEELYTPKLQQKGSKITRVLGLADPKEEAERENIVERSRT